MISYIVHRFAYRAQVTIGRSIIDKLMGCKWVFVSYGFVLHPVKLIVLDISGNALMFQPLIILFAAITSVCCDVIRFLFKALYVFFNMIDHRIGIGGLLMDAI